MPLNTIVRQILSRHNRYKNSRDGRWGPKAAGMVVRPGEVFAGRDDEAWVKPPTESTGILDIPFDVLPNREYVITYVFGVNGTDKGGNYFRDIEYQGGGVEEWAVNPHQSDGSMPNGVQLLHRFDHRSSMPSNTPMPDLTSTFTPATESTPARLTLHFDQSYTVGVGEIVGIMVGWR